MYKKLSFLLPIFLIGNEPLCTIAIDIGHSPKRGGATSANGVSEYQYNFRAAGELNTIINDSRVMGSFIINPNGEEMSLQERVQKAKAREADLFISLHHDSTKEQFLNRIKVDGKNAYVLKEDISGFSILVSTKNKYYSDSLAVSRMIGGNLITGGYQRTLYHTMDIPGERRKMLDKDLGVYRYDDTYVIKKADMPAVLIEKGFIVNKKELENIDDEFWRNGFLVRTFWGIAQWCNQQKGD